MDQAMVDVAERLAREFSGEPSSTVIRVATDCVSEIPDSDPLFIEHAARARLRSED